MAQVVKNVPAMWETWVPYLGWEDPLEKGMATHCSIPAWKIPWTATHCSIPAWKIPWTEEPGGLQSMGLQWVGHNWVTNAFTFFDILWRWLSYLTLTVLFLLLWCVCLIFFSFLITLGGNAPVCFAIRVLIVHIFQSSGKQSVSIKFDVICWFL